MTHACVCFERRLPRKIRSAKLSGSLDVGHVFSPRFLSCDKKGGRLPGRDPASSCKHCQRLPEQLASHAIKNRAFSSTSP